VASGRRPTPAEYSYGPDETPTRPDGIADPALAVIVSVYRQESEVDRRKLSRLVETWHALNSDQRILVEWMAVELAKP
jgi:hypothetical protein